MLNTLIDLQNQLSARTPGSQNWYLTVDRVLGILLQERIDLEESRTLADDILATTNPNS